MRNAKAWSLQNQVSSYEKDSSLSVQQKRLHYQNMLVHVNAMSNVLMTD